MLDLDFMDILSDLLSDMRLLVEYADGSRAWRSTGEIRIRLS